MPVFKTSRLQQNEGRGGKQRYAPQPAMRLMRVKTAFGVLLGLSVVILGMVVLVLSGFINHNPSLTFRRQLTSLHLTQQTRSSSQLLQQQRRWPWFSLHTENGSSSSAPGKQGIAGEGPAQDDGRALPSDWETLWLSLQGHDTFRSYLEKNKHQLLRALNHTLSLPSFRSLPGKGTQPVDAATLALGVDEARLKDVLESLVSVRMKDILRFFLHHFTSGSGQPRSAGPNSQFGGQDSSGVIVRRSSTVFVSTKPGNVKLPLVQKPSSAAVEKLPPCPETPPKLVGGSKPITLPVDVSGLEKELSYLAAGGDYSPPECRPGQRLAIIIPYRNRWNHLHVLLRNLVPFLVRQQLSFTIFVIEQELPTKFNRALLLNVGTVEASLRDAYNCFVFHDVDLIPLNDYNLYRCREQPLHLAAGISKFGYGIPYGHYVGGVTALSREQVEKINGNSNRFFGWGGEDDELWQRIRAKDMKVARNPPQVGRYDMFKHNRDRGNEANPVRFKMLKSTKLRMNEDGLNSLQYNVTRIQTTPLYTWISVKINPENFV